MDQLDEAPHDGEPTCPRCSVPLVSREVWGARALQCPQGHGVFLDRAELGALAEAEAEWHRGAGPTATQPLPRITPDMTVPPPPPVRARSFVETLFG